MRETEQAKGALSVQGLWTEGREGCAFEAGAEAPADAVLGRVFAEAPVDWVRLHVFQLESLKMIALRMLKRSPYYRDRNEEITGGLRVFGEMRSVSFASPMTILAITTNAGGLAAAHEVAGAVDPRRGEGVAVEAAESALRRGGADLSRSGRLLLYLNSATFSQPATAATLRLVLERGVPVTLLHEQDGGREACQFCELFDLAPRELQLAPYKLFDTIAVPLYQTAELRAVSLRQALYDMGARPLRSSVFAACRGRLRWRFGPRRVAVQRERTDLDPDLDSERSAGSSEPPTPPTSPQRSRECAIERL